jgi:hypothetical protein
MRRISSFATLASLFCFAITGALGLSGPIASSTAAEAVVAASLPGPGPIKDLQIEKLEIETGQTVNGAATLSGLDARQQLVVTAHLAGGQLRDLTHDVVYEAVPAGIVTVDKTGQLVPLVDGRTTITARLPQGPAATVDIVVTRCGHELPVNFPNQVVPIFTKLSCNSGGCHGKASGQNGFKLSLLGFEPTEDYEHLVKEGRGRRLFPAAPEQSLLLRKPLGDVPHGGGNRLEQDSYSYRIIRRWILQGMPYGSANDPTVSRIEVFPKSRSMTRGGSQQLLVIAHYSDGTTEDVTGNVKFEANNTEMAEASDAGLVKILDLTGDVAVMARYQGQVDVFRATVPLGAPVDSLPPAKNFVDDLVFKKLKELGLPPSAICDDATFLRRASIDIAGRAPTAGEAEKFLQDKDPAKRDKLIEALLASGDYADHFATKWNAVLRNKKRTEAYTRGTYVFHAWIRDNLYANTPWDDLVRQILTASGEMGQNPPVTWYREVKDIHEQVQDTAQLFLGLRIKCAQCHHHPYEKWSQQDYYGLAGFFSQVGRKKGQQPSEDRIFAQRTMPGTVNPKTQLRVEPTGLGAGATKPLTADADARETLADWVTAKENPFFARALVNRYWKHFLSRGLVEPEDDMRVTNPATNPALLDALADHFQASGYDLKELVRTICRSQVYQLSSEPNAYNASDKQNYSRYYPKRLEAEVLLDAVDRVTGSPTDFSGLPTGTRAIQLPDTNVNSYFLTVFGRPEASSACECERSGEANLAQSLHLLNSAEVQNKLASGSGRVAQLAADKTHSREEKIRSLYLDVFSREPKADEMAVAIKHIEKIAVDKDDAKRLAEERTAMEDILWALINTKEFLFNH